MICSCLSDFKVWLVFIFCVVHQNKIVHLLLVVRKIIQFICDEKFEDIFS